MKPTFFLLMLLNPLIAMTQQLDYYPEQKPDVSDEDYKYGINILRETYQNVINDGGTYNYADYWNIGIAYILLQEDTEMIREMLHKSKAEDMEKFAKIFLYNDALEQVNKWKKFLPKEEYNTILKASEEAMPDENQRIQSKPKKQIKFSEDYNQSLMSTFKSLQEDDLRYRMAGNKDFEKQLILDQRNIEIIDLLYDVHKTYIGESFVGAKYKNVMWSVIQHSHLNAMEKYLPVIHEATKRGELQPNMLNRLLDRIYMIKCGYQIFGTQMNTPLGPLGKTQKIRKEYELNAATEFHFPAPSHSKFHASKEKADYLFKNFKSKQS